MSSEEPAAKNSVQFDAPNGPTFTFATAPEEDPGVILTFVAHDSTNGDMRFEWSSTFNPDEARQLIGAITDATRAAIAEAEARRAPPTPGANAPSDHDALEAVRAIWAALLDAVAEESDRDGAVLREALVLDARPPFLLLGFRHSAHAALLTSSPASAEQVLARLTGREWRIQVGPAWPGDWAQLP